VINLIVAMDSEGGIGKDGGIPWNVPLDMEWFKEVTLNREGSKPVLILGSKTRESLPEKGLPGRELVVLSSKGPYTSLKSALEYAGSITDSIYIIGGATVYGEALKEGIVDRVYLSEIEGTHLCDTFFPMDTFEKKTYLYSKLLFSSLEKDVAPIVIHLYSRSFRSVVTQVPKGLLSRISFLS